MVFQVFREVGDEAFHLRVFEHEVLRALRLVVELRRQLHILNHSELRRALQLVLVGDRVLHAHRSDLHEHVLPETVDLLDPVLFNAFDECLVSGLLLGDFLLPELQLGLLYCLVLLEVKQVVLCSLKLGDLVSLLGQLGLKLISQLLDRLIYQQSKAGRC